MLAINCNRFCIDLKCYVFIELLAAAFKCVGSGVVYDSREVLVVVAGFDMLMHMLQRRGWF